ncbi:MAG: SusC/RagA family TonB-linked outer membrane protein [Paludibacter sp.]|nr:SusC/RagA family TonB-linked outer membrane protein [Paludibacter sp.]
MNDKYIIVLIASFLLFLNTGEIFGQKDIKYLTIKSVVIDDNGTPIPNVRISGKEGAIQVQTSTDGEFTISVPEKSELLIEADGFNKILVSAINVSKKVLLTKSPYLMGEDDVINIAFNRINTKEKVNPLSAINPEKIISKDYVQNVGNLLNGRISGLMNNSMLRGKGEPLIVINGIPRSLNSVTAEEINQITVLKDVNASILYGSRAKNGVILITTKRGNPFKRKINLSVDQGYSTPIALPQYLGSAEYMRLYNEALTNDGLPKIFNNIEKYESGENNYRYPNTDYFSDEFLKAGKPATSFISEFSGGNKTTQYYANFGWINSGSLYKLGSAKNSSTNRLNARANVDVQINDFIKSNIDAVVIFDINKNPNGNFWEYSNTLHPNDFSPLLPLSMIEDKTSIETAKLIEGKYILGGTSQYMNNVYGNMYFGGYVQNIQRTIQVNNGIDIDLRKITPGLCFKTYISFDVYNSFIQSVNNKYAVYMPTWSADNVNLISSLQKINEDTPMNYQNLSGADFNRTLGTYASLNYDRTFNAKHSFAGTVLAYYNTSHSNYVVVDDKYSHIGLRGTYDYAKKYFIDFSGAYVHSTKLFKGNRDAFSPSVGLSWILSEENFIKNISQINYLKVKLSGGILNTDIDITNPNGSDNYYMYDNTFIYNGRYYWGDGLRSNGVVLSSRQSNPNLTFEKMKDVNLGIEAILFNNMINVDANIFYSQNSGKVIQRVTYPAYLSTYIPFENYNANSYSGAELGINLNKSIGSFSLDIGANILYATSNIDKRDEVWNNKNLYRQGKPVNSIFGLEYIGFFSDSDISNNNIPVQAFGEVKAGDIKYKDQNNDNVIDQNDEIMIGKWLPDFSYGIHCNLKYRNLNLFILGNGQTGGNGMYDNNYFWVDANDKYSKEVLNRWTPATALTATYPRLTSKSNTNNYRSSTFWLYENNFFSINRIQLTYDFPIKKVQNTMIKGLSLYLRGSNLLMIAKDAEKRQLNIGTEPAYRNYAGGLRIIF